MDAEASFPAEVSSAPAARRFATDVLRSWQCDPLVDSAQLLVSELVANAVLHARSTVSVRIRRLPARIRVEIGDASSEVPRLRAGDPGAVTGRGLMIVDAVAAAWGVDPTEDGKIVWFELEADDAGAPRLAGR